MQSQIQAEWEKVDSELKTASHLLGGKRREYIREREEIQETGSTWPRLLANSKCAVSHMGYRDKFDRSVQWLHYNCDSTTVQLAHDSHSTHDGPAVAPKS